MMCHRRPPPPPPRPTARAGAGGGARCELWCVFLGEKYLFFPVL
eukprot:COSAG01_NODE_9225_length_2513_cov_9.411350_5_plen_43_part_01